MKKLFAIASIAAISSLSAAVFAASPMEHISTDDMISWAHDSGITKFDSWNSFGADMAVTREQAAKMITTWIGMHHQLGWGMTAETCTFTDADKIDPTLIYGVESACAYGLFKGYKGEFMPKNNIPAADVNTLIARAAEKLPDYSVHFSNVPALSHTFLTRGELLTALYYMNVAVEGKIAHDKEEALSAAWAQLNNAKAKWESKNVEHYVVTQQLSCFCTPNSTHPVQFDVMSGSVVTGTLQDVNETDRIPASQLTVNPMTVEQAFAFIQDAIDREADSIDVAYDAEYGFPTKMNIDYSVMMADEEQYYTYSVRVVEEMNQ